MSGSLETITALFNEELRALDAFVSRRESEGRLAALADDPDVRRILEALALFSARTRAAASMATWAALRRIAGGTLDDLLPGMPAALLVVAKANEQLVEATTVPAGTQLRVEAADGRVGLFSTTAPLTVLPARVEGAELREQDRRLFLRIGLRAWRAFRSPGRVSFSIRKTNDYRASLALKDAIAQNLVRAFATADGGAAEIPCTVTFGARPPERVEDEVGEEGLLARTRAFFHQPERALFLHVDGLPPAWNRITFQIELDPAFPGDMAVPSDAFQLSVAPAANVWSSFAEPIVCDGTQDSYAIRYPSPLLAGVELHRVRGVYRATDSALPPLPPMALSQDGDAYDLQEAQDGGPSRLVARIAGAFDKPAKLLVDAQWSQPGTWSAAAGRLAITPQTRHLPGVSFSALGPLRRPEPSPLASQPSRILDLLSLRMRPLLDRRDIAGVLEILGTAADGAYRGAHRWIEDVESVEEPDPTQAAGRVRRSYRVAMRRRDPDDAPLARSLFAEIAAILEGWTEEVVDVQASGADAVVSKTGRDGARPPRLKALAP